MNKFLIMYEELYNLNQMHRLYMTSENGQRLLLAVFNDKTVVISSGTEEKIKQQFKIIKYFLLSNDEVIEI